MCELIKLKKEVNRLMLDLMNERNPNRAKENLEQMKEKVAQIIKLKKEKRNGDIGKFM